MNFINNLINGRKEFSPTASDILKRYGNEEIESITIFRQKLQDVLNKFVDGFTGQTNDKLVHLAMIVRTKNNNYIKIDKAEQPRITLSNFIPPEDETMIIKPVKNFKINEMINQTIHNLGDDGFFRYDALNANCQDFILNLLKTIGLNSHDVINFVKQDLSHIKNNKYLGQDTARKILNTTTDIKHRINMLSGNGIQKPRKTKKKKHI